MSWFGRRWLATAVSLRFDRGDAMSVHGGEGGRWTIITPNLSKGVFAKKASALAEELLSRGLSVEILYLERHGEPVGLPGNLGVSPLRGRARDSVLQIARHFRERRPDVVVSMPFMMNVPCLIAARIAGYRGTVLVNEGTLPTTGISDYPKVSSRRVITAMYNTIYRRSDSIVCNSEAVKAAIESLPLSERVRRKLTVIPNPVDLRDALGSEAPSPVGGDEDPMFLSIGRLVALKRVDLSIAAFAEFVARNKVGHLVIAGSGEEEPDLRRMAKSLGVEDRVHFLGYVGNIKPLLSKSTSLLHLAESEGFGTAVAEALSAGTPAIVARGAGGPEELIGDGGVAVKPDARSVSEAMDAFWQDADYLRRMRDGAVLAGRKFAPELVAGRWVALAETHHGSHGVARATR